MSLLSRAGGLHLAYLAIAACGSPPPPALPPPTPPALPAPTEPEVTLFAPGVSPFGRTWSPSPDVVLVREGAALYTTSDGPVPAWNLTGRLMMPATVEKNGRVEVIPAGFNAACRVEPITSPLAPAMWVRVDDLLPVLTRAATLRWPDNSRIVVHAGFPRDGADWLSVRQVLLGHLPTSAWGSRATSYPVRTDADTAGWTGVDVSTWDRTIEVGGVRHELRPGDAALPSVGDAIPPLGGSGLSTLPGADLLRIVGWDGCIVATGKAQGVRPNGQPDVGPRQFVRGLIGARGSGEVITWGPFTWPDGRPAPLVEPLGRLERSPRFDPEWSPAGPELPLYRGKRDGARVCGELGLSYGGMGSVPAGPVVCAPARTARWSWTGEAWR